MITLYISWSILNTGKKDIFIVDKISKDYPLKTATNVLVIKVESLTSYIEKVDLALISMYDDCSIKDVYFNCSSLSL